MADKDLKDHEEKIELLAQQAQNGDTEAFSGLYDFFIQPLYRYIYFRVSKQEAMDLTENVFLKIWEHLKSYRKGKGSFTAWVFRIAHNMIVDHYRLQKNHSPLDFRLQDENKESDPVFLMERRLSSDRIKMALSRLNKKYQQILLLKYVSELDNAEIAHIMGKSEGSLRILKFRALRELKKVLENIENG